MTEKIDLLIHNANQLCIIPAHEGRPQRGSALGDLGIIENGAITIHAGKIVTAGPTGELRTSYDAKQEIDASGCVVRPGFVDPHTHLVWAGDRAAEFEMRIA